MYLEEETGNYYVSVKNFCSFLNFFRLKSKLDEIPENEHAVIDFSLCSFVDHTVMEGLNEYRRGFARKGGAFEIIGLDAHTADTQHPFAIRKSLPSNDFFKINNNLNVYIVIVGTVIALEGTVSPKLTSEPEPAAQIRPRFRRIQMRVARLDHHHRQRYMHRG